MYLSKIESLKGSKIPTLQPRVRKINRVNQILHRKWRPQRRPRMPTNPEELPRDSNWGKAGVYQKPGQ